MGLKKLLKGAGKQIQLNVLKKNYVSSNTFKLVLEIPEGYVLGIPVGNHIRL